MAFPGLIKAISNVKWLEPASDTLQRAVGKVFDAAGPAGRTTANALHGTWLRHPLHPALTDVPVGAWTAAAAFDAIGAVAGSKEMDRCADAAIGVGLVGAAGAAVTGLTDWHQTDAEAKRIGLAHGLLNTGAVLLYGSSLLLRRRGSRGAGRGLAFAAYAVAGFSAYLGGHLVYEERVGVDHAADIEPPADFVPVMRDVDLREGQLTRGEANGVRVLLLRRGGRIHALLETCTHLGGPLAEGEIEGDGVVCPWHGSRFSLETGEVLDGPAVFPQRCLEVQVRDGQVEVRAKREATAAAIQPAEAAAAL